MKSFIIESIAMKITIITQCNLTFLFSSIPDLYVEKLVKANILDQDDIDNIKNSHLSYLNDELQNYESYEPEKTYFERQWTGITQASDNVTSWDTGLDYSLLSYIGKSSVYYPDNFVSNIDVMIT